MGLRRANRGGPYGTRRQQHNRDAWKDTREAGKGTERTRVGASKADGRKSRLRQCDSAETRQQTDGEHDRQWPAGSDVTKNRATNAEGVRGFSHRNSRSTTKETTEQVCQPQTQEKITKNSRKKEIMGGEETMEVACATDK